MFPGEFWLKYFFRVCHIGSLVVLCQAIITSKITGEIVSNHKVVYMIAGIVVVISGKRYRIKVLLILSYLNLSKWGRKESYGWHSIIPNC
jgi:hypothetical protein